MRQILAGTTGVSVVLRIINAVDGTPETGVVFNTAGIDLQYRRELAASVAITEATLAALTTAHSPGGFLHIGNGYYRLDLPDAAVAVGAVGVLIHGTVTGMIVIGEYIDLVAYNPYDAANLGLSTLSTLLSRVVGTLATGTHQPQSGDAYARLGAPVGASLSADVATKLAPTVAGRTLDVTTTGEAGIDWSNIGAPTTAQTLSGTTIATSQVVASVTGAVASVTGAVGSVTGNVGGNVTGSVGSVAANGVSNASLAADTGLKPIRSGTAQAGSTATTLVLDAGASATDDFYNNLLVTITGGVGIAQTRRIRDYTGSTKTAVITRAWVGTPPDNASTFAITPNVSGWDEFVADHTTAATFGATTGQSLSTSELIDNLVGPLATVQANGANTATVFQIDISTVTEAAANWWVDAWLSFDLTSALAGQVKKITAFNQTTGMVTVASAYTAIPTATNTARIVTR